MAPQELAARQADDGGWYALKLGEKLALHPAKRKEGNDDWAKHIATVCEEDARQAHGVARAIADGGAAKLGDLAKQHVLMRRRARASCATAMVLASMVESALRTELEARLHAADADWRSLY
jgi:hypothetical protein